ncbi:uncharacterized protein MONOS_17578 [Monocercomonoides exilis]|uniref:uncharacterized protein n=1 Tax=Monocercomonoides exilis TaxID=2049356 RepID=UPI0035598F5D|nr:hypothetical protein MONOS_17578 [Monocercomonoides exilis]
MAKDEGRSGKVVEKEEEKGMIGESMGVGMVIIGPRIEVTLSEKSKIKKAMKKVFGKGGSVNLVDCLNIEEYQLSSDLFLDAV